MERSTSGACIASARSWRSAGKSCLTLTLSAALWAEETRALLWSILPLPNFPLMIVWILVAARAWILPSRRCLNSVRARRPR